MTTTSDVRAEDGRTAPVGASVPRVNHVFFAADFGPGTERAWIHTARLARALDASVTLFHAITCDDAEEAEPREALWHLAAHLGRPHVVVVERVADARTGVVDAVAKSGADLVVIAARGQEGLALVHPGSVGDALLRRAACPVLCVRTPPGQRVHPYRRLLVPVDFTPASRRALGWAALLQRTFEARVTALHVAPVHVTGTPGHLEQTPPREIDVYRFCEEAVPGLAPGVQVASGSPWDTIVETADREQVDLLVITTHGHDSFLDRVIGSHAERIVRHACRPVLVV